METRKQKLPRIMIAGISSGSGKTTLVCGILQALKNRGIQIAASKCGPDYIDPMFHSKVIGIPSNNIDLFFATPECATYLMARNAKDADLAVIEGVMGYYDGMQMDSIKGSSYDVARTTKTPVILVVPCKGMALSVIPIIQGMMQFQDDSNIQGVILNGITKGTYMALKEVIEERLPIKVLGYLPRLNNFQLESRHLGLVTPQEIENINIELNELSKTIEETIDLNELIKLAQSAPDLDITKSEISKISEEKLRIGVAYDKAFCFYYKDNLEVLKEMGCEMVYFSPLEDSKLPENLQGLLLGGGYPELYCEQLSSNKTMLESIKTQIESGLPCLAECGGFMYLHERLEGEDGKMYPMANVLQGEAVNKKKLVRFGYINLTSNESNPLLETDETIAAHEFHYWDSTENGETFLASKPSKKKSWNCGVIKENLVAGYPHLYYYSNLKVPERFTKLCKAFKLDKR